MPEHLDGGSDEATPTGGASGQSLAIALSGDMFSGLSEMTEMVSATAQRTWRNGGTAVLRMEHAVMTSGVVTSAMAFGSRMLNAATMGFIRSKEGNDSIPAGTNEKGQPLFKASYDSYGRCYSIGPGLTQGINANTLMTQADIDKQFHSELQEHVACVERFEQKLGIKLNDDEFGALVDLSYNGGPGKLFGSSGCRGLINVPGLVGADGKLNHAVLAQELQSDDYNRTASGHVLDSLKQRRADSMSLADGRFDIVNRNQSTASAGAKPKTKVANANPPQPVGTSPHPTGTV